MSDVRKTVILPADLWAEVADFRFGNRIATEAEALRRLILAGLAAEARPAKAAGKKEGKR